MSVKFNPNIEIATYNKDDPGLSKMLNQLPRKVLPDLDQLLEEAPTIEADLLDDDIESDTGFITDPEASEKDEVSEDEDEVSEDEDDVSEDEDDVSEDEDDASEDEDEDDASEGDEEYDSEGFDLNSDFDDEGFEGSSDEDDKKTDHDSNFESSDEEEEEFFDDTSIITTLTLLPPEFKERNILNVSPLRYARGTNSLNVPTIPVNKLDLVPLPHLVPATAENQIWSSNRVEMKC